MSNGKLVEIEKIKHYPNKETVYNFEVENNHNYYVAE
jgi:intein/homing endonuclease